MVHWGFERSVLPNPVTISIQSDITFYQFTANTVNDRISIGEPIICPEAESKFWISIYDNSTSDRTDVGVIVLFDESPSGTAGWGWQFYCLQPGSLSASAAYTNLNNCTGTYAGYKAIGPTIHASDRLYIGGPYTDNNLMAFIWPPCYRRLIFNYAEPEHGDDVYRVETMQGMA